MAMLYSPVEAISRFNVSRESLEKLQQYVDLLVKWQKRINLIGPSTVDQIWLRHIADALQLMALIPKSSKTIVDAGSGAGIPGLVLAMVLGHRPDMEMHLVESNDKKAAFLREAVRVSGAPAIVHNCRIEQLAAGVTPVQADVVLARALAPLPKLLELTETYLSNGAIGLFHKGQDVDSELTQATKYWIINVTKHASVVDSRSWILEIRETRRVACL